MSRSHPLRLRKPGWLTPAYAIGAILALTATPAFADGLAATLFI
jgi:hypothetical protein